jgi:ADP-ribose pyrophosphatase
MYDGKILNLRIDTIALPEGGTATREIIEHGQAVVLVAEDPDGRVLLVRQYRKAVERFMLELPAGNMNSGEEPETAALREMQEETGFLPGRLERLGGFFAAPGYCEEYLHLFLAIDLKPDPLPADEDEDIELIPTAWEEIPGLLESGEICDAKSVAGLWWALGRRRR